MTKRVHPIRKMQRAIHADLSRECVSIARHVKPLLDALERAKADIEAGTCDDTTTDIEEVLAVWRAKL